MDFFEIGQYRLFHQGVTRAAFQTPGQVVTHLGAMQAQDYPGALWAIGLRMKEATVAAVEQAILERTLVRTWPMRGTLHFVPAEDVRWMLELLTPRVISSSAARQCQLEIDAQVLARSQELLVKALEGGKQLTRPEIYQLLAQGNIKPDGQRGIHIIGRLAQEGLLCFGPFRDKQPTFVLLDEWLPPTKKLERDEALAVLAKRYFTGHGPATLADLERWAGIKTSDARAGLEAVKAELRREEINGQTYWMASEEVALPGETEKVHLLPGFDEFILGYKDRSAVLEAQHSEKIVPGGNGMFISTIVSEGRVAGTWKRAVKKGKLQITPVPFTSLNEVEMASLTSTAQKYARFIEMPVEVA